MQIMDLFTQFTEFSRQNPVVAGVMSLWGVGVFTYICRDLPKRIIAFIYKHLTTTVTLMSTHRSYHLFLKWLHMNDYVKKMRKIKISNGSYGYDNSVKSIGYGTHLIWWNKMPIRINMDQMDKSGSSSSMEKDKIELTWPGRSHTFVNNLFEEINSLTEEKDKVQVYTWGKEGFTHIKSQRKRSLSSIFISSDVKEKIINFIEGFAKNEEFYISHGLNYQTGVIFHGPPGCGKTSIIKALASYYEKPLYILPASRIMAIESAMSSIPEGSFVLIEDIDGSGAVHDRSPDKEDIPSDTNVKISMGDVYDSLSDILNAIDGVVSSHGRILFATTNYIDKLDGALIRPGRFDLNIEISYADNDVLRQFMENYYPEYDFSLVRMNIKENVTPCMIQNHILNNLENPSAVLKEMSK